jgi:hypothetical protein
MFRMVNPHERDQQWKKVCPPRQLLSRGLPWIEEAFEIDAARSRYVSVKTFLH